MQTTNNTDEKSLEIVRLVYAYRFLSTQGLAALTGLPADHLQERLDTLCAGELLIRIHRPALWEETAPDVYGLDRRGADWVASESGVDRAQIKWSRTGNHVKLLFLEHTLRVNDARIAFTLAARGHPDHKLVIWREGLGIADRAPDPQDATKWLPVRPDGYFCYRVEERRAHFFLEIDLGTESNHCFRQKVRAYIAYRQSGRYRERYGAYAFRVLTVTTSERRMANLLRTTEAEGGGSMFWFTTFGQLREVAALEPCWSLANRRNLKALF